MPKASSTLSVHAPDARTALLGVQHPEEQPSFQIGKRADAGFKEAISKFIHECTTRAPEDPLIYAHYRALKALLQ